MGYMTKKLDERYKGPLKANGQEFENGTVTGSGQRDAGHNMEAIKDEVN